MAQDISGTITTREPLQYNMFSTTTSNELTAPVIILPV